MEEVRRIGVLIVLAGCGRVGFDAVALRGDAGADGSDPVRLGPFGSWQPPVRQPTLNTNSQEFGPALSADGLEVIFSTRFTGDADIWRATRTTRSAAFGARELIPQVMSTGEDAEPTLSYDGTTIVFQRGTAPLMTTLWSTTRTGTTWSAPMQLDPAVFTTFHGPDFGSGDLSLQVNSASELFEFSRDSAQGPWGTPRSLGLTFADGGYPSMRSDGLEIYFERNATGDPPEIFRATRASRDDPFGPPEKVLFGGSFDSAGSGDPDLSEDGEVMAFVSDEPNSLGLFDIYITRRAPL